MEAEAGSGSGGSRPFCVEVEARKIYRFRFHIGYFHIAFVDTEANHTSSDLKEILLDTSKQFSISKQQVLACVVDNASNITRTVRLLNEDEGDEDDDEEIKEIQDLLSIDHTIYHMRCAKHTLQLGIRKVLKKGQAEKFLTKLRKFAQHLRSPHTDGILKRRASKGMLIDMPTRRGSTPHASTISRFEMFCSGSWLI